jgi:hypothetical protein
MGASLGGRSLDHRGQQPLGQRGVGFGDVIEDGGAAAGTRARADTRRGGERALLVPRPARQGAHVGTPRARRAGSARAPRRTRGWLADTPGQHTRKLVHPICEAPAPNEALAEIGGVDVHAGPATLPELKRAPAFLRSRSSPTRAAVQVRRATASRSGAPRAHGRSPTPVVPVQARLARQHARGGAGPP